MMRFLQVHAVSLTPLTPIHVGCDEDFEPTNYVIVDGVLYHFDPSLVPLDAAGRKELAKAVQARGDEAIRNVQRFFHARRAHYVAASRLAIAVAPGVAEQYESRIGRVAQHETGGARVTNQLEIERTAHHPHSGEPYLPGSSLKGALRTAWIDRLNQGRSPQFPEKAIECERHLLGGAFHTDPFRLLRLGDASGQGVLSKVVFSTNQKKRAVIRDNEELSGRGPAARREVIAGGQYRALTAEIRFDTLGGLYEEGKTPGKDRRVSPLAALAKACNGFYIERMEAELKTIESRRFATDEWIAALRALLTALRPLLEDGRAMLVRVGRHSGAESVTVNGWRRIRIMKGPGQPPDTAPEATTLWMAAERERERSNLLPFGWVLIEESASPDNQALRRWCEAQAKPDLAGARKRLAELQRQAAEERARNEREHAAQLDREETERREAEAREQRLRALSTQGKEVEALRTKLEKHTGRRQPVSGALYAEVQRLIKSAQGADWPENDRLALAKLVDTLGFAKIDFAGREKDIRRALKRLRGEG